MRQRNNSSIKLLSIIVPAYKQEKTIIRDILNIKSILEELGYNYEIIIVIDGMIDTTFQKVSQLRSRRIKVMGYEKNQGKGHAVRYGMLHANGDIIGFIDAGMDI